MFRKLIANDEAVKNIFDHFRNIGIAGAVLAAGAWTISHPATGALVYMSYAAGASICILGLFLFLVAERHGSKKLKEANLPLYWEFLAILVYSLAVLTLFTAAALRIELH